VYGRNIEGKTLTLEASGRLYRDALILADRETDSLWTQEKGEAVEGPLEGKELPVLPGGVTTTWARWRELHPDTLVLKKPQGMRQTSSVYAGYFSDPEKIGVFGSKLEDRRLEPKAEVLGLELGGQSRAYPYSLIEKTPLLVDELGGVRVLLAHSTKLAAPVAFLVPEGLDALEREGDRLTAGEQAWDLATGKRLAGSGPQLEPVAAVRSFWYAWVRFHPDTTIAQP
jgi:hypothetical protein